MRTSTSSSTPCSNNSALPPHGAPRRRSSGPYYCSIHPEIKNNVAEVNGPYSFYLSPVTIQPNQLIVWRNRDTETHHVVLDDGSIDTGTLAPGTSSQPLTTPPVIEAITARFTPRWSAPWS